MSAESEHAKEARELRAEVERLTLRAERAEAEAARFQTTLLAARASEARLREALRDLQPAFDRCSCPRCVEARAALAGTPSGEPSEYAMRVAEAVREALLKLPFLASFPRSNNADAVRAFDLAAVVKGVR